MGGGSILNTNVESSGWAPSLQKNYRPPQQEEQNNYMQRVGQNTKQTKVGGGGSILNTNVESSGWVTDFEKQKPPEYWKAKQEYQDIFLQHCLGRKGEHNHNRSSSDSRCQYFVLPLYPHFGGVGCNVGSAGWKTNVRGLTRNCLSGK